MCGEIHSLFSSSSLVYSVPVPVPVVVVLRVVVDDVFDSTVGGGGVPERRRFMLYDDK